LASTDWPRLAVQFGLLARKEQNNDGSNAAQSPRGEARTPARSGPCCGFLGPGPRLTLPARVL